MLLPWTLLSCLLMLTYSKTADISLTWQDFFDPPKHASDPPALTFVRIAVTLDGMTGRHKASQLMTHWRHGGFDFERLIQLICPS